MATQWAWVNKSISINDSQWFKKIFEKIMELQSISSGITSFDVAYTNLSQTIKSKLGNLKDKSPESASDIQKIKTLYSMIINKKQPLGKNMLSFFEEAEGLSDEDKVKYADKINVILDFYDYVTKVLKKVVVKAQQYDIKRQLEATQSQVAMYIANITYNKENRSIISKFSDISERLDEEIENVQQEIRSGELTFTINKGKKRDAKIKKLSYKKYFLNTNNRLNTIVVTPNSYVPKIILEAEKLMADNKKYLSTKSQVGRKNIELKNSKNVEAAPKTKIDFSTESDINKILNAIENI